MKNVFRREALAIEGDVSAVQRAFRTVVPVRQACADSSLRILTFAALFPDQQQPAHGVFVSESA
jgi:hypothetical protein